MTAAWNRFWFEPRSIAPLAFVRVVLGLLIAIWGLSLLPDARAFLGPEGVLPAVPEVRDRVGLLQIFRGDLAPVLVVGALVPAGLAVALGWWTRTATIVSFVLLLSVSRRNPWILNSGDALLRHAVLFLALTPAGEVLSLDRWRRDRDGFWQVPHRSPWGLRLLQLQLCTVYLFSVVHKLRGTAWLDGTALADSWRLADLARFDLPMVVYDSAWIAAAGTGATLVIEAALAVLIWHRRLRPYVIATGLALHLGIELSMAVGFFSAVACTLYLAFVPHDTAERWLARMARTGAPAVAAPP